MKTRSPHSYYRTLLMCSVVSAMVAPANADDGHLRIKIPNPIPKIVNGVKRVGIRVGNIVVRTAERIDGDEERVVVVHTEAPPPYLAPLPPPETGFVRIEPTRPPLAPRSSEDFRYTPVPPDGVRNAAPLNLLPLVQLNPAGGRNALPTRYAPAEVRRSADSQDLKIHEAAYPQSPRATAAPSLVTVSTPAPREQPAAAAEKPAPPPEHPYGKPVPGRPGLVYPPGMKEIPENMIDVRGITPGTKVRDPATKMVFRVP